MERWSHLLFIRFPVWSFGSPPLGLSLEKHKSPSGTDSPEGPFYSFLLLEGLFSRHSPHDGLLIIEERKPLVKANQTPRRHFPHAGDSELFEGDNLFGVKFLSHEGTRM